MKIKTAIFLILTVSLVALSGNIFAQKTSVKDILALVDANLTKVQDTTYSAEVSVVRNGKKIKTMKFEAILKGLVMKKIIFQSPGDVRGMAVLTTEEGEMYVYMPSYKRVRRVASHVRNQGFMGTDITAEEMGTASLSSGWEASIQTEDEKNWVLKMTPKAGTETEFSHMIVTVSKKYKGVEKIESYNAKGKLLKLQTRGEWQTFGVITIPTFFEYTDMQTGSKTQLRFFGAKVNQGISNSVFTKRSLMRGE
ncbi:MAG: outer membrane lipoprotein-sorting protein [Deltaproteobacteria bacterium]|nr:outer membrane lipoprotein-sorting protein [Deltaproteobacteria bacterium]